MLVFEPEPEAFWQLCRTFLQKEFAAHTVAGFALVLQITDQMNAEALPLS